MKLFVLGSRSIYLYVCVVSVDELLWVRQNMFVLSKLFFLYFVQIKSNFSMWLWFYDRFRYDAPGIVCKFLKPLLIIIFYISFVRFVILWSSILFVRSSSSYLKLRYFYSSPLNLLQRIMCRHIDRRDAIKEIK